MHRQTFIITIPGFATNEQDTTCIPSSQLLIKTINQQFPDLEVIVITLDHPRSSTPYQWFGNKIIPLNGSKYLTRPLLWLKLYRLLKKIHSEKNITGILNLWCADNALVSHHFSKRKKIKNYTWLRGQDARKGNKALLFFKPHPNQLIALSDALEEEFYSNYQIRPAHTVYPGIAVNMFHTAETASKDIDIIGIGSLTSLKRYHILIELVAQLKMHHDNINTLIVGKGPEETALRQQILEKGLQDNVTLYGEADHSTIPSLMARSKILLHPSSYEGYSGVCLEALASGCHVVSFTSAEKKPIPHWHILKDEKEMEMKCLELMKLPADQFSSVIPHTNVESIRNIMRLYQPVQ